MKKNAVLIDPRDNVVTATEDIPPGGCLCWAGGEIHTPEAVASGHKVAIVAIAAGETVRKYGHRIGNAAAVIEPGAWVHTHNLERSGS